MTDTHFPMTAYDRHQERQRIAKEQHMSRETTTKTIDFDTWLANPLTKALKQSHQDEVDALVKDADKAHELLRRAETEMRYARWNQLLTDNYARKDIYDDIKEFLK